MTIRRAIVGPRANGDTGLFISPPEIDAFTAPDSELLLSINSKISQLILLGSVSSSQTISLGQSEQPIVLVTSYNSVSSSIGNQSGPSRPSPVASDSGTGSSVAISGGGASMSISCAVKTVYAVYSKAFG